ncbi:hypothetical protein SAMN05421788_102459 [Filimonas lacunae]|uniref:Uncharacterized protein n=1 Tax=Filimonas lacunae TaxID=477680 RepID=A0A173MHD5_9BACT|nr:hypothetical protein [Filimonas lacunae]BAV06906.1 hypothetical protein FLA_2926 [Filimonas lacunae]SIS98015.1 hypothetical protein SAMN05421788_102459 [Filimonas lacunae]
MNSKALIQLATAQYQLYLQPDAAPWPDQWFSGGGAWMQQQLCFMRGGYGRQSTVTPPFGLYGVMKYGLSVAVFILALVIFYRIHFLLSPLAIVLFYVAEVHFLFLFPLLIDQAKYPLLASVRLTYKIGVIKAVTTVMPVAAFMLLGLFNREERLKNWFIGCLAILIWYEKEMEHRV